MHSFAFFAILPLSGNARFIMRDIFAIGRSAPIKCGGNGGNDGGHERPLVSGFDLLASGLSLVAEPIPNPGTIFGAVAVSVPLSEVTSLTPTSSP